MRMTAIMITAGLLAGCASAQSIPLSADTVQINSSAAIACGAEGAARVAFKQAAIATIKQGYDRFIIVGAQRSNNIRVVGRTPVVTNTTFGAHGFGNSIYGSSQSNTYGGAPIYGGRHNQGFVVKMFKNNSPYASQAIDARTALGPDWETQINEKTVTCF